MLASLESTLSLIALFCHCESIIGVAIHNNTQRTALKTLYLDYLLRARVRYTKKFISLTKYNTLFHKITI